MICNLCPRNCGVERDVKPGFCGMLNNVKIARAELHFWEEPEVSGVCGSGTVFFTGCNLKCVYCQNHIISQKGFGKEITTQRLAQIFMELEKKGAHNINLVTPTHYTYQIIEALNIYKPKIPVVYNTSGYESVQQLKLLEKYVDVYLTDFKYYCSNLSQKYSNAANYFEVATKAISEMFRQQPKNIVENGIIKKGVIIRHMVLPNHTEDSINVLQRIKNNFGCDVFISVMGQYTPCFNSKNYIEINRKLKPIEYKVVCNKLVQLGFKNGHMQSLESACNCYIPLFNLEGA